ncbi:MAG: hypothetical protein HZB25_05670 [Candidatus Eisenbacteria bacterium]|nr:hypothetical protein [Candidatus Eisenbacteria bacterium]
MMRIATRVLLAAVAVTLVAGVALAGAPLSGNYKTNDIGGPISVGRYTEGWAAGGGALLAGTTMMAESWNGVSLGTEWRYTCGRELTPGVLIFDAVDGNGNGNRTYMKTFTGGMIWLSGSGPWGNGDPFYSGPIDSYREFETVQYSSGQPVAAVTNVQAIAHFIGYPSECVAFTVANGLLIGSTAFGMTKPADYPGFLDGTTCNPTMTNGAWWNMMTMTLSINNCATPVKAGSWGALKRIYR